MARWIAGKQSPINRALLSYLRLRASWGRNDYESLAQDGYITNPYVFSSIRQISTSFAGVPWRAYTDQSKNRELDKHDVLNLLKRPNPREGGATFFENHCAYLHLAGNAYLHAIGPDKGPPTELYTLRPDRMSIVLGTPAEPIAGYLYKIGSEAVPLPAEVINHQKFFHPLDDLYGLSPMEAARRSVVQNNWSKEWNVGLLQNNAKPAGAMISEGRLDDEQFQRLRTLIREEYSGYENAGLPILLEGGLKWEEMGLTPADMHWLEGQKLSAREIAIVYNIAPELIGDSANKTYSNYGEARKSLYQENILPLLDKVRDDLNNWLSPRYGNVWVDYDRNDIEALQEDRDKVYARTEKAWKGGWIKLNEARKDTNYEEEEDEELGDLYQWELPIKAPAVPVVEDPNAPPQGEEKPPEGDPNVQPPEEEKPPEEGDEDQGRPARGGRRAVVPFARRRAARRSTA